MVQVAHEALPTVKCSSCSQPVPLANLSDHVCPPPSLPALQKPPMSPKSAANLLPQRLQSLVARSDALPYGSSSEKPSEVRMPSDPSQRQSSMATPKATSVPFPKSSPSPSTSPLLDRDRPQLPGAPTPPLPPPDHVSTPARDGIPPALQRARFPSSAGRVTPLSPAFSIPPGGSTPLSSARRDIPPPFTDRSSSNATPPSSVHRGLSFERTRSSSAVSTSRPSLDKSHPPLDKLRPSFDVRRPSPDSHRPSTSQNSSGAPFARIRTVAPATGPGTVPFPSEAPVPPLPMSARQPPPPPLSLAYSRAHVFDSEIDTKIGGEAGMAGVGRRGFAAAARAAMVAASRSPHRPAHVTTLGDRANVPQYLDTNATFGRVPRAAITPPLSPNSVQTPSPVSPLPISPISLLGNISHADGQYINLPSPHDTVLQRSPVSASNDKAPPLPFPPCGVRIASPSRSPSPIPNPFERRLSGETITQSPLPDTSMPLPFFDILKPELNPGNDSDDESVYTTHTDLKRNGSGPPSPSADSDVSLAYAHDSDVDTPVVMPLDIRKSGVKGGTNEVKFPSVSSARGHPAGPSRQTSAASSRSAFSSRSAASSAGSARTRSASAATQSTARSVGALERAMETLIEEGASVSVLASGSVLASIGGSASSRGHGKPSRSNTVPGPASPEQRPPKLPTRSHTNPAHPHIHCERVGFTGEVARIRNRGSAKRKDRVCVGCDSKIADGRWIQMDGGNVLCERCWKNMYLPKCRRCSLPIEKQAVSSRDGQLKGKYHKECFNCHTCHKPFPDKEFYVFDGKPFCAYHYHEANNSLCGAPSCGQPVEGPCAVTHSGKRYHPEHLLCEFEDGCKERLEEYWEVDGQMLCERHAAFIGNRDNGWTRSNDPAGDTQARGAPGTDEGRMMKRMTRFIDLGAGGDDDLAIR